MLSLLAQYNVNSVRLRILLRAKGHQWTWNSSAYFLPVGLQYTAKGTASVLNNVTLDWGVQAWRGIAPFRALWLTVTGEVGARLAAGCSSDQQASFRRVLTGPNRAIGAPTQSIWTRLALRWLILVAAGLIGYGRRGLWLLAAATDRLGQIRTPCVRSWRSNRPDSGSRRCQPWSPVCVL